MGRDGNTRPVPFSMGIPVPLTPMIVLVNFDFQEGHLFQHIMESRRMKLLLLLAVYSTENSAAVGAWVFLNRAERRRADEGGYSSRKRAQNSSCEIQRRAGKRWRSISGGERESISMRNVDRVEWLFWVQRYDYS